MNDLFMGGLLGCKMTQSSFFALRGGGVNFLGGVSVTISHMLSSLFFLVVIAFYPHI
jgi:hypothetical protein